jgi:hypothetical protein
MTPKIEIKEYTEHDDGSATIAFEVDYVAREVLISEGLISLIEKAVSDHNHEYNWKIEGK